MDSVSTAHESTPQNSRTGPGPLGPFHTYAFDAPELTPAAHAREVIVVKGFVSVSCKEQATDARAPFSKVYLWLAGHSSPSQPQGPASRPAQRGGITVISRSVAMRSSSGGCVLKSDENVPPSNMGFTIHKAEVVGVMLVVGMRLL